MVGFGFPRPPSPVVLGLWFMGLGFSGFPPPPLVHAGVKVQG